MATESRGSARQAVRLYGLSAGWRAAFDAARTALDAAASLPPAERRERRARLTGEVASTEALLQALARNWGTSAGFQHLLVSPWEARRLLGLPPEVSACVFNLDGVLIGSAALHAAAWTTTFEEFIANRVERTRGRFAPFNPRVDYPEHMHGRPRLDGVRAFLASRGIRLPEGEPTDRAGAETVHGLAKRKNELLLRRLDRYGVTAYEGSRRYLELAHDAGVHVAVVSASANTDVILERSGLAELIEERVDGNTMLDEGLRVKPAPDTLLAACRKLGVAPANAAAFETTRAGIAAGRTAGFDLVIGVDGGDEAAALRAEGADVVVGGISDFLDRRLAA